MSDLFLLIFYFYYFVRHEYFDWSFGPLHKNENYDF